MSERIKPRKRRDGSVIFLCQIFAVDYNELIRLFREAIMSGRTSIEDFIIEYLGIFDGKYFFRVYDIKRRKVVWQSWIFKR